MGIQDIAKEMPLTEYFRLIFQSEQLAALAAWEANEYLNELEKNNKQEPN
jgi:hypothetical protein